MSAPLWMKLYVTEHLANTIRAFAKSTVERLIKLGGAQ